MTVHCFNVVCSTEQQDDPASVPLPDSPSMPDVVGDRVANNVLPNFSRALTDDDTTAQRMFSPDHVEHVAGMYRFDGAETAAVIAESLRDNAVIDAAWFAVYHHACTHAESDPSPCPDWAVATDTNNDAVQYGAIPDDVRPT